VTPGVTQGQSASPSSGVTSAVHQGGGRDSGTLTALVTQVGLGAVPAGGRGGAGGPGSGGAGSASGSGGASQATARPNPPASVTGTQVNATQALDGASRAPIWLLAAIVLATAAALALRLTLGRTQGRTAR
jgi:hypothetical protein